MSKKKDSVKLTFVGGNATGVTGSSTLIEINKDFKMLFEAGLEQGDTSLLAEYKANTKKFQFKPKEIKYVFISHAHQDHAGLICRLVKEGFNGKIICPKGNKQLLKVLWLDCAKILEKDAYDLSKRTGKNYEPIYKENHVYQAFDMIEEYEFDSKHTLPEKNSNGKPIIEFQFIGSGHILNSAQCIMWIRQENNSVKKIGFTGDLGNVTQKQYYVNDFSPINSCQILVGECTYSNKKRCSKIPSRHKDLEKMDSFIQDVCIDRKGSILIPVFAFGRLEQILTELYYIYKDKEFNIPIIISSPLGRQIMNIYLDELPREQREQWDEVLTWNNIKILKSFEELENYMKRDISSIYLSPGGFLQAGHSVYILEKLLPRSKNGIIFCGYSTPSSLAGKIKEGKQKTITINGYSIYNRANLIILNSFSSHMDYFSLLKYYSDYDFQKICLVHSNFNDKLEFAETLQEELSKKNKTGKVIIVNKNTSLVL